MDLTKLVSRKAAALAGFYAFVLSVNADANLKLTTAAAVTGAYVVAQAFVDKS